MGIGIFIGKLLGITLVIWFLFYKKKEMPNLQKWGLSLGFSLLFLLAMFGLGAMMGLEALIPKNIDGKSQSGLNTELKKIKGGVGKLEQERFVKKIFGGLYLTEN